MNDNLHCGTVIAVCNCRLKNFPWISIDLGKEIIKDLKWEPTQARMCIIQKDSNVSNSATQIRIFDFTKNTSNEIFKINSNLTNDVETVWWSPIGRHLLFHHDKGKRTFFDIQNKIYKQENHENGKEIYWSPCGRYAVSTNISNLSDITNDLREENDDVYVMYSYQGKVLAQTKYKSSKMENMKHLFTFTWRPRQKSLLTDDQRQQIKKDLKTDFWKKYERRDKKIKKEQSSKKSLERLEKKKKNGMNMLNF